MSHRRRPGAALTAAVLGSLLAVWLLVELWILPQGSEPRVQAAVLHSAEYVNAALRLSLLGFLLFAWGAQGLGALGRRCAVIGTLGVGEPPAADADEVALDSTGLTTPDAVMLQRSLRELVDRGFVACAIEASSIGLAEHRLDGTHVDVALFGKLTRDHLDYHGSMADYWAAKRRLFDWPGLKAAVVNVDDAHGAALAEALQGKPIDLWTCSLHAPARLRGVGATFDHDGLAFTLREGDAAVDVRAALVGDFNVANLLLVIGALRALGMPLADAPKALSRLGPVPGRTLLNPCPALRGRLRIRSRRKGGSAWTPPRIRPGRCTWTTPSGAWTTRSSGCGSSWARTRWASPGSSGPTR